MSEGLGRRLSVVISALAVLATVLVAGAGEAVAATPGSAGDPFTSLLDARTRVDQPGIHSFDIEGRRFSTFVDRDGWVLVASGAGATAEPAGTPMATTSALTLQSDRILPAEAVRAMGTPGEVRLRSTMGIDAITAHGPIRSAVANYVRLPNTNQTGTNTWVGSGAGWLASTCSPSDGTMSLAAKIYHSCGVGEHLHWASVNGDTLAWEGPYNTRATRRMDNDLFVRASYSYDTSITYPTDGVTTVNDGGASAPVVAVNDMVVIGNTVFVGGAFRNVWQRSGNRKRPQAYLAAFDGSTGEWIPWFRPELDGPVHALAVTPDDQLLIGGEFTSVNRVADTQGLAKLDPSTGLVDANFTIQVGRGANATTRNPPYVREIRLTERNVYAVGNFTRAIGGPANNQTTVGVRNAARFSLSTGTPDPDWVPNVNGGLWAVAVVPDDSRVFLGGRMLDVDGKPDTRTLAAVDGETGAVVPGWKGGLPWPCYLLFRPDCGWPETGGIVYGLGIVEDKLFIGGAEHAWAIKAVSDGRNLKVQQVSNDAQRVDVVGTDVFIGCHCVGDGHWVRRVNGLDGNVESNITAAVTGGGDGGWAATRTPDGCVWWGGHFTQARVLGLGETTIANMGRTCPTGGPSAHSVPPVRNRAVTDTVPPATPAWVSGAMTANGNAYRVQWAAASDNVGPVSYRVYRNGALVAITRGTRYDDVDASPDAVHTYSVVAFDATGLAAPTAVHRRNGGTPPPVPPSTPTNLTVATDATANPVLSWDRVGDTSVMYSVRRNGAEVARFVPETSTLEQAGNTGNTTPWTTGNVANLYDDVRSLGADGPMAITVDLGTVKHIDSIGLRYTSGDGSIYLSDTPFTTWNRSTLNATAGVTRIDIGNTGGVVAATQSDPGGRPINQAARYVRIVPFDGSTATMKEFGVYTRFGPRVSFVDAAAPGGRHSWDVVALLPHESTSAASESVSAQVAGASMTVTLSEPAPDATVDVGAPLDLAATVSAVRTHPIRVDFHADGDVVATDGSSSTSPFRARWTPTRVGTYSVTARAVSDTGVEQDSAPVQVRLVCPRGHEAREDGTCRILSRGHLLVAGADNVVSSVSRIGDGSFGTPVATPARGTSAAGVERPDERISAVAIDPAGRYVEQVAVASPSWSAVQSIGGSMVDGSITATDGATLFHVAQNGNTLYWNRRSSTGAWSGFTGFRSVAGNRVDAALTSNGRVAVAYVHNGVARSVIENTPGSASFPSIDQIIGGSSVADVSVFRGDDGQLVAYLLAGGTVSVSRHSAAGWTEPMVAFTAPVGAHRLSAELIDGRHLVAMTASEGVVTRHLAAGGSWGGAVIAAPPGARDVDVISNRIGGLVPSTTVSLTAPVEAATIPHQVPLEVTATVSSVRGGDTSVEFLADGVPIAKDETAPFSVMWTPPAQEGPVVITARATVGSISGDTLSDEQSVTVNVACGHGWEARHDGTCRVLSRGHVMIARSDDSVVMASRRANGSFWEPLSTAGRGTSVAAVERADERVSMVTLSPAGTHLEQRDPGSPSWTGSFPMGGNLRDGSLVARPDGSQVHISQTGSALFRNVRHPVNGWSGYVQIRGTVYGERVDATLDPEGRVVVVHLHNGSARSLIETSAGSNTYPSTDLAIGGSSLNDVTVTRDERNTVLAHLLGGGRIFESRWNNGAWTPPSAIMDAPVGATRISTELVDGHLLMAFGTPSGVRARHRTAEGWGPEVLLDPGSARDVVVVGNRSGGFEPTAEITITSPAEPAEVFHNAATTVTMAVSTVRAASRTVELYADGVFVARDESLSPTVSIDWTPPSRSAQVTLTARVANRSHSGDVVVSEATRTVTVECGPGWEPPADGTCRARSSGHLVVAQTDDTVVMVSRRPDGSFLPVQPTPGRGSSASAVERPDERVAMVTISPSGTFHQQTALGASTWTNGVGIGGTMVDGALVSRADGSMLYVVQNGTGLYRRVRSAAGVWDSGFSWFRSATGNRVDLAIGPDGRAVLAYLHNGTAYSVTETSPGSNTFSSTPMTIWDNVIDVSVFVGPLGHVTAHLLRTDRVIEARLGANGWSAWLLWSTTLSPTRVSSGVIDGQVMVALATPGGVVTRHQSAEGWGPTVAAGSAGAKDVDIVENRVGGSVPSVQVAFTSPNDGSGTFHNSAVTLSADVKAVRPRSVEVEFLADGEPIGRDDTAPYSIVWTPPSREAAAVVLTARATMVSTSTETLVSEDTRLIGVECGPGWEARSDGTCVLFSRGHAVVTDGTRNVLVASRRQDGSFLAPQPTPGRGSTAAGVQRPDERLGLVTIDPSGTFHEQTDPGGPAWTAGTGIGGTMVDGTLVSRPDGSMLYVVQNGSTLYTKARNAAGGWSTWYTSFRSATGNRVDMTLDRDGRAVLVFLHNGTAYSVSETSPGSNTFSSTALKIWDDVIDVSVFRDAGGQVVAHLLRSDRVIEARLGNGVWGTALLFAGMTGLTRVSSETVDGRTMVALVTPTGVVARHQRSLNTWGPFIQVGPAGAQDVDLIGNVDRPGAIGDRVWRDVNRDGIQDPGEPGLAGVALRLLDRNDAVVATTTTAADGTYRFGGLHDGSYRIAVDTASWPSTCEPTVAAAGADRELDSDVDAEGRSPLIRIGAGEQALGWDIGCAPKLGTIGDFVWSDVNGNHLQDPGEPGIPDVSVELLNRDDEVLASTVTDASGRYRFDGLWPGAYRLRFDLATLPDGCRRALRDQGTDDGIDSDITAEGLTFTLVQLAESQVDLSWDLGCRPAATAAVGDLVWRDLNGNHLQDAGEPGIPGVVVELRSHNGALLSTATTDADGRYRFDRLDAGRYNLRFDLSTLPVGCERALRDQGTDDTIDSDIGAGGYPATLIHLDVGQEDMTWDLGCRPTGSIGDRVWRDLNGNHLQDPGEPGIAGVKVELQTSTFVVLATTVTDENGYYRFDGLDAGAYNLRFDLSTLPAGCIRSVRDQGTDDTIDSDIGFNGYPVTLIRLAQGQEDMTWDLGCR